jgi:hypothetical protein
LLDRLGMARLIALLATLGALVASRASAAPDARAELRAHVVSIARRHLGERFRGDCSEFVRRVYAEARAPLPTPARSSESIYRGLARVRRPRPGDLAFFHRTYDREPPGPRRNLYTHVALVEAVSGSRVSLIHRTSAGIQRFAMNLSRPADPGENGAVRRRRPDDRPHLQYLAGELFAGYASPFRLGR